MGKNKEIEFLMQEGDIMCDEIQEEVLNKDIDLQLQKDQKAYFKNEWKKIRYNLVLMEEKLEDCLQKKNVLEEDNKKQKINMQRLMNNEKLKVM